jgi:hypothetical protein
MHTSAIYVNCCRSLTNITGLMQAFRTMVRADSVLTAVPKISDDRRSLIALLATLVTHIIDQNQQQDMIRYGLFT